MYTEDDLLPISALQHLIFCERQCALIHIEGLWAENRLTVEGRQLHDKAHEAGSETRHEIRITRAVPLVSYQLGLSGVADVVEWHRPHRPENIAGENGHAATNDTVRVVPIEYKRGRPKRDYSDRVQLAAQAIALEEMQSITIESGAIYYGKTRRRLDVPIDPPLRQRTADAAQRLHTLIRSGRTPSAELLPKCKRCSLYNLCLPHASRRSARRWFSRSVQRLDAPSLLNEIDE